MVEKTPEKRLLDIIEGKSGKIIAPSPALLRNKYLSFESLRARIAFLKDNFIHKRVKDKSIFEDLKRINLFLQCAIGIAVVSLFVFISIEIKGSDKISLIMGKDAQANVISETAETISLLKPKDYYLEKFQIRDFFEMGDMKKKEVDFKEEKLNQASQLAELTKNLKLVGISWGEQPDAIIENVELDKTYFVKKGYMIDDIKVYDVLKDRVILRYKGEEVEVR